MFKAFITGISGFVGYHLALRLAKEGFAVYGCDNDSASYNPPLKHLRKQKLEEAGITIYDRDILDIDSLQDQFIKHNFSHLFHLAGLSSIRESFQSPITVGESNIMGFIRILEFVKQFPGIKVVFASSGAVYGQQPIPFSETSSISNPTTMYGAAKGASELIAHTYHQSYGMDITSLRCFNIYGPYGRPDRPPFLFAQAILDQKPITLFRHTELKRDFVYIDDAIDAFISSMDLDGFHIINVGSGSATGIEKLLNMIEKEMGRRTEVIHQALSPAEVIEARADLDKAKSVLNFSPKVPIEQGIKQFIQWFRGKYETN